MLALAPAAHGTTIVVSQPIYASLSDYSPAGFGQSFTTKGSYQITAIDLFASASSGGSDATLSLYHFNPATSALGQTILATGTFTESMLGTTGQWVRITLDTPVNAGVGDIFGFIVVAKDPGGIQTGWNSYGVSSTDLYADGNRLGTPSNGVASKTGTDLAFQIVAVPETAAPALSVIGILLLAMVRRR